VRGLSRIAGTLLAFAASTAVPAADPAPAEDVARGEYLVVIMECGGCHTAGALRGQRRQDRHLAGSEVGLGYTDADGRPGAVFPPNLTSDPDTGLGRWTDEQILNAFRHGQRPDGRVLSPAMPWPAYGSRLTEADALAIVAYLRSLPPLNFRAPANFAPGETPTGPYMIVVGE
jgi:mono/diheme cytochrome c family protein